MRRNRFDTSAFIVTTENHAVAPEDFDTSDKDDGMFVMLTNDILNCEYGIDNTIYIHKQWNEMLTDTVFRTCTGDFAEAIKETRIYVSDGQYVASAWQCCTDPVSFSFSDYPALMRPQPVWHNTTIRPQSPYADIIKLSDILDGKTACDKLMRDVTPMLNGKKMESYIPAIMAAYHTSTTHRGKSLHGYLPSIGQLIYISKHIRQVNHILADILCSWENIFPLSDHNELNHDWWSSTEVGFVVYHLHNGITEISDKVAGSGHIIPLYQV